MASLTRSERRPDDPSVHRFLSSPRHQHHHHSRTSSTASNGLLGGPLTRSRPTIFQHSNSTSSGRTKRGIDVADRDIEALKPKRARIAVEILAKPQPIGGLSHDATRVASAPRPRSSGGAVGVETVVRPPQVPPQQHQQRQPQPQQQRQSSTATTNQRQSAPQPTKHQEKVRKGIKHELDRLQPQSTDTAESSGRKLRSQEATRFKSELAAYFPDYDEVVGNDPKEHHLLNPDTPIVIIDSARDVASTTYATSTDHYPVRGYGDALFTDIFDAQRIDFSFLESQFKSKSLEDPLPDSTFEGVHKRAERLERSIRNTEKGRAQHEKDQIIRLLEGLQGHDWLRVMGISGITDSRKKSFEPARAHFIKGCQAIIDKFRNWTIEEKRRKAEKERTVAEEVEKATGGPFDDQDGGSDRKSDMHPSQASSVADGDSSSLAASSDVSSPAKQLREEALAHSRASRGLKRPRPAASKPPAAPPKPPEPPKEFKSFFTKKYERDGALNRHRRAGRKVLAWGHPVPELQEVDFDLPLAYRDEETMRSRARKKRKDKRSSRT
ncbi:hypothetical protein NLU13_1133 [Sarocladium strictum]|uniref:Something about silencing protein 4 domain-containing protein n=1 Tax=Sarocladium strictum TaxID=5046 RepID=A0AA39GR41_SARSR|nr:hypothetical protein NLU13_1133 [Sarocladium strictum]